MKRSVSMTSDDTGNFKNNKTVGYAYLKDEVSLLLNTRPGLPALLILISLLVLVFDLKIYILPVAVAIILSAAVGITVFVMSYVVEFIIELRNNGE